MPKSKHYEVTITALRKGGRGPGKKIIDATYALTPAEFKAVNELHSDLEAAAKPTITKDTVVTLNGAEYRLGDLLSGDLKAKPARKRRAAAKRGATTKTGRPRKKATYQDTPESQARKALKIYPKGAIPKDKRDEYKRTLAALKKR
jgi:hypothetical protein